MNMAVFLYLVKSDFSSVRYYTHVHWKSHFLQGTRKTRTCLTGHPVASYPCQGNSKIKYREIDNFTAWIFKHFLLYFSKQTIFLFELFYSIFLSRSYKSIISSYFPALFPDPRNVFYISLKTRLRHQYIYTNFQDF